MSGLFISVEGIEGVGKSTAVTGLHNYLASRDIPAVLTREPGGTPNAEHIRDLLLGDQLQRPHGMTELMLMYASRLEHAESLIKPALQAGKVVLSDRFFDASFAYQGGGRGLDIDKIQSLNHWVLGDFKPDVTLLLDAPLEQCLRRMAKRASKDRIEQEHADFFNRVRAQYLALAEQDPRFICIDATQNIQDVRASIVAAITPFITAFLSEA